MVKPLASTTLAPAGILAVDAGETDLTLLPSIIKVPLSIAARPLPSIILAPTKAVAAGFAAFVAVDFAALVSTDFLSSHNPGFCSWTVTAIRVAAILVFILASPWIRHWERKYISLFKLTMKICYSLVCAFAGYFHEAEDKILWSRDNGNIRLGYHIAGSGFCH
jgi:hypothetical protein